MTKLITTRKLVCLLLAAFTAITSIAMFVLLADRAYMAGDIYLGVVDESHDYTPDENPLIIKSLEDLIYIRDAVNSGDKVAYTYNNGSMRKEVDARSASYRLMSNIVLSGEWTPIGNSLESSFTGTFDGYGKTVSGLLISDSTAAVTGLFGYNSGVICNVVVQGSISANNRAGGIAGVNTGEINGCTNEAVITTSGEFTGGIAGENKGGRIYNCANKAAVRGFLRVGGITGACTVSGSCGIVRNSYNHDNIRGEGKGNSEGLLGGIAGSVDGSGSGRLENCYNYGSVSYSYTNNKVTVLRGGIAGKNSGSTMTIKYCYTLDTTLYYILSNNNFNFDTSTCGAFEESDTSLDILLYILNSWVAGQSSYFMWVRDAGVTGSMRLPRLITPDFDDGQDDDVPSSEVSSISVSYGGGKSCALPYGTAPSSGTGTAGDPYVLYGNEGFLDISAGECSISALLTLGGAGGVYTSQMLKYRLTGSDNAYVYEYPGGETFDLYVDIISSAGYVYEVVYDADGDADKYTETTFFIMFMPSLGSYYINEGVNYYWDSAGDIQSWRSYVLSCDDAEITDVVYGYESGSAYVYLTLQNEATDTATVTSCNSSSGYFTVSGGGSVYQVTLTPGLTAGFYTTDITFTYNHGQTLTVSVDSTVLCRAIEVTADTTDGAIFSYGEVLYSSSFGFTVIKGTLAPEDVLTGAPTIVSASGDAPVYIKEGSRLVVGEYRIDRGTLSVAKGGVDVSDNYDITYKSKGFTVAPLIVTVTVDALKPEYVYGEITHKTALQPVSTGLLPDDEVAEGEVSLSCFGTGDAAEYTICGNLVPGTYKITKGNNFIIKNGGTDITSCYSFVYAGIFEVVKRAVMVTATYGADTFIFGVISSAEVPFCSFELSVEVASGGFLSGAPGLVAKDGGDVSFTSSGYLVPGEYAFRKGNTLHILESDGMGDICDVTDYYDITVKGSFTVIKRPLPLAVVSIGGRAPSNSYEYGEITSTDDVVVSLAPGYSLVSGENLAFGAQIRQVTGEGPHFSLGGYYVAGEYNTVPDTAIVSGAGGEDITFCYDVAFTGITFTVMPRQVKITAAGADVEYGVYSKSNHLYSYTAEYIGERAVAPVAALMPGDSFVGSPLIMCADGTNARYSKAGYLAAGEYAVNRGTIGIAVSGELPTAPCYDIVFIPASFNVLRKAAAVAFTASDKVYDGTQYATVSSVYIDGGTIPGDDVFVNSSGITAMYSSADAGENIIVTASGFDAARNVTGSDAENYIFTFNATSKASIVPKHIDVSDFVINTYDEIYTGQPIRKDIKTSLRIGYDYFISYENNVGPGIATVTLYGCGNYQGSVKFDFKIIDKGSISEPVVDIYHTVVITCSAGGTVYPAGKILVADRDSLAIIIMPDVGYEASKIIADGLEFPAADEFNFTRVSRDHFIYVEFIETTKERSGLANFTMTHEYTGFRDTDEDSWYGTNGYGYVRDVVSLGLMVGDGNGIFRPSDPVTIAEAIKIAAVIHNIYTSGGGVFENNKANESWYIRYVDYAIGNGIINDCDFDDYTKPCTRAQLSYILARAIDKSELVAINEGVLPPDVNGSGIYDEYILLLYQAGVLTGRDTKGTFYGDDYITRAEVAAVAVRLVLPDRRILREQINA